MVDQFIADYGLLGLLLVGQITQWLLYTRHERECAKHQADISGKLDRVLERLDDGAATFDDHEDRIRALEQDRYRQQ